MSGWTLSSAKKGSSYTLRDLRSTRPARSTSAFRMPGGPESFARLAAVVQFDLMLLGLSLTSPNGSSWPPFLTCCPLARSTRRKKSSLPPRGRGATTSATLLKLLGPSSSPISVEMVKPAVPILPRAGSGCAASVAPGDCVKLTARETMEVCLGGVLSIAVDIAKAFAARLRFLAGCSLPAASCKRGDRALHSRPVMAESLLLIGRFAAGTEPSLATDLSPGLLLNARPLLSRRHRPAFLVSAR